MAQPAFCAGLCTVCEDGFINKGVTYFHKSLVEARAQRLFSKSQCDDDVRIHECQMAQPAVFCDRAVQVSKHLFSNC